MTPFLIIQHHQIQHYQFKWVGLTSNNHNAPSVRGGGVGWLHLWEVVIKAMGVSVETGWTLQSVLNTHICLSKGFRVKIVGSLNLPWSSFAQALPLYNTYEVSQVLSFGWAECILTNYFFFISSLSFICNFWVRKYSKKGKDNLAFVNLCVSLTVCAGFWSYISNGFQAGCRFSDHPLDIWPAGDGKYKRQKIGDRAPHQKTLAVHSGLHVNLSQSSIKLPT